MRGTGTFPIEVSHVSRHGFWILAGEEELLLPYEHFPWFRHASIDQIMSVERPTADHLHWPLLDIGGLEQLARFHRDAMLQSGAHALQHLAEEFDLFQEVLAVTVA